VKNTLLADGIKFIDENQIYLTIETQKLLSTSGVSHLITSATVLNTDFAKSILSTSANNPFNVYETYNHQNKFYMVNNFQVINTLEDVTRILKSKSFSFDKTAILEEKPIIKLDKSELNYKINIQKDEPTEILLSTVQNRSTILIFNSSYYPGWKAIVNGIETKILPANINSSAILLQPGKHDIKLIYKPHSLVYGVYVSSFSFLILIIFVLKFKTKKLKL